MRYRLVGATLWLALIPFWSVRAQAGIAGTWLTEFDTGIRSQNGAVESMGTRQATLTLTVGGDSVFGTWQVAPVGNEPAPAAISLKGTATAGRVTLEAAPVERTVRINEEERRVPMVASYSFVLRADSLVGSTKVAPTDGSFDGPERPFVAIRARP